MPDIVDQNLTPSAIRIYEFIRQYWIDHGEAPSQYEIMRATKVSMASIQNGFKALKKHGHVDVQKYQARTIRPVDLERRLFKTKPDPWDSFTAREPWEPAPARRY